MKSSPCFSAATLFLALVVAEIAQAQSWNRQYQQPGVSLRGLSAVNAQTCWASGSQGTVVRTTDGGQTWQDVSPPGTQALDFRDIQAFDDQTAVIMSAGDVDRLYRTEDGGRSWALSYEHPQRDAFFDGMAFWNRDHGLLMGDPLDGTLLLLETDNGGRSWRPLPIAAPRPEPGEAGFAASGTNLCVGSDGRVWVALGGADEDTAPNQSHIWYSADYGRHWEVMEIEFPRAPAAGIFSIAYLASHQLVAVGGRYTAPDLAEHNLALTRGEDQAWLTSVDRPPSGYRSAVAEFPGSQGLKLICVGPSGTDISRDGGQSWSSVSTTGFHTLAIASDGTCWAAGSEGRIAKWHEAD